MTSIEISVKRRTGRLFFDGLRVSDGAFLLDTRKVQVRVRKQCLIAPWANSRLGRSWPFVVLQGKHSKRPLPNLQRAFRGCMKHETRPVVYEGVYTSVTEHLYAVLKPMNGSSWRVMLGLEYFELFCGAGLRFESPLPEGKSNTVGGRYVSGALRIVTQRGALVGFLMPCRPGGNMAELRERVVKDVGRKAA